MATIKRYLPYKTLLVWDNDAFGMSDLFGDFAPTHELVTLCSNGKRKLNGKRSKNVVRFNRTGNKLHPTEKPVDLFKFLIEKSTNPGEIVLDPFAGSATTAVAAIDAGRQFICTEKDEKYFNTALERITSKIRSFRNDAALQ
jgi:site-specific DNA-methyltransferase (adenine-specific)